MAGVRDAGWPMGSIAVDLPCMTMRNGAGGTGVTDRNFIEICGSGSKFAASKFAVQAIEILAWAKPPSGRVVTESVAALIIDHWYQSNQTAAHPSGLRRRAPHHKSA